jgi:pathogenesis-related protein 1
VIEIRTDKSFNRDRQCEAILEEMSFMNNFYRYPLVFMVTLVISSCSTTAETSLASVTFPLSGNGPLEDFVPAHNTVRSRHRLPPLKWSPQLANYAQQWADQLRKRNNCRMKHRPHTGRFAQQYGENLLWVGPTRWSDGRVELYRMSPEMITDVWADERRDYRYRSNSCKRGKICGHYTQVVWRDTQEIGCAKAVCRDQSQLWVCNYNPPGNYRGKKPY